MSTGGNDSALALQGDIGAEHQHMAELIGILGARIRDHESREAILTAAQELGDYTNRHFTHEKEVMALTAYPAANAHLWEHRTLLDKLAMLLHSLEGAGGDSGADVSSYVIDFIDRWFVDHVQGSDAELGAFLATRGVK